MNKSEPIFAHLASEGSIFERPKDLNFDSTHRFYRVESKDFGEESLPHVIARPVIKNDLGIWTPSSVEEVIIEGNELITIIEGHLPEEGNVNAKMANWFNKIKQN